MMRRGTKQHHELCQLHERNGAAAAGLPLTAKRPTRRLTRDAVNWKAPKNFQSPGSRF